MNFLKYNTNHEFSLIDVDKFDSTYDAINANVGGYIERANAYFDLPEGVDAWVNEDGLTLSLPPILLYEYTYNKKIELGLLVGDVVFTGDDGSGSSVNLTDEKIDEIIDCLAAMPKKTCVFDGRIKTLLFKSFIEDKEI